MQEEWAALTLSGSAEEKQAQLKYSSCEGFPVCLRAQTSRNLPLPTNLIYPSEPVGFEGVGFDGLGSDNIRREMGRRRAT